MAQPASQREGPTLLAEGVEGAADNHVGAPSTPVEGRIEWQRVSDSAAHPHVVAERENDPDPGLYRVWPWTQHIDARFRLEFLRMQRGCRAQRRRNQNPLHLARALWSIQV